MMAVYHGKSSRVYMAASGSTEAIPLTNLVDWSVDTDVPTEDVTVLGVANARTIKGIPTIKGKLTLLWDNADDTAFTAAEDAGGVKMYCYPTTAVPTKYWYGYANIAAKPGSFGIKSASKVEVTFDPSGDWGRK